MTTGARPAPLGASRYGRSLERRLPLQISSLIGALLLAALAVTYATLSRTATRSMEDRLERSARQLATVSFEGLRQARPRWQRVTGDSAVRRALFAGIPLGTADARVAGVLGALAAPTDSGLPIELWTATGRRVAWVGNDLRAARPGDAPGRNGDDAGVPIPYVGVPAVPAGEALTLSPLQVIDGRVHFWIVAPVLEEGKPIGYVAHLRRASATAQTQRTIRELVGDSVVVRYRNVDGSLWTALDGRPVEAPGLESGWRGTRASRPGVGELIAAESRIGTTPLVIVLELARDRVLTGPRRALVPLAGFALALLVVGAILARRLSRSITTPIGALGGAVDALARGDYAARAEVRGDGEVARLADGFNRMAAEVSAAREELERRNAEARAAAEALGRTNAELVAARAEAERASRAKTEFLTIMSHELRTPLNAIGGYTELLEMELRGPITDAQRRDLDRIRVSQQHLLGLVSAVLDMSRIEQGRVAYDVVTIVLDPFLGGLDALVGPQAAAKQLSLEYVSVPPDLAVVGDREKLRQALLNLLSNAIRHTPPGGRIVLEAAPASAGTVAISVRDTGPGIPEEKFEQIFDPFVQLDRTMTSVREGIGLGLAISRELVRGMGGELTVRSRPGEGSCFTVTLPRGDASDAAPVADRRAPGREG